MSITMVLRSPTVSWKGKYFQFTIHIYQVKHTVSICFIPLIDFSGAGSSTYFYFMRSLSPTTPSPSELFRCLFVMSVLPLMFRRIYPSYDFHAVSCSRKSSSYTFMRDIVSPIDITKVMCFWYTVTLDLGTLRLDGMYTVIFLKSGIVPLLYVVHDYIPISVWSVPVYLVVDLALSIVIITVPLRCLYSYFPPLNIFHYYTEGCVDTEDLLCHPTPTYF